MADQIKRLFQSIDQDNDGIISKKDLKKALAMAKAGQNLTEFDTIMDALDEEKTGNITFENFVEVIEHLTKDTQGQSESHQSDSGLDYEDGGQYYSGDDVYSQDGDETYSQNGDLTDNYSTDGESIGNDSHLKRGSISDDFIKGRDKRDSITSIGSAISDFDKSRHSDVSMDDGDEKTFKTPPRKKKGHHRYPLSAEVPILFEKYDAEKRGYINVDQLGEMMCYLGKPLNQETLETIESAIQDGNGKGISKNMVLTIIETYLQNQNDPNFGKTVIDRVQATTPKGNDFDQKNEIEQLRRSAQGSQKRRSLMKKMVAGLRLENEKFQKTVSENEVQLQDLRTEVSNLNETVESKDKSIESLEKEKEILEVKYEESQEETKKKMDELELERSSKEIMISESAKLKKQLDKYEDIVSHSNDGALIAEKSAYFKEAIHKMEEQQKLCSKQKNKILELEEQLEHIKQEKDESEQNVNTLRQEVNQLRTSVGQRQESGLIRSRSLIDELTPVMEDEMKRSEAERKKRLAALKEEILGLAKGVGSLMKENKLESEMTDGKNLLKSISHAQLKMLIGEMRKDILKYTQHSKGFKKEVKTIRDELSKSRLKADKLAQEAFKRDQDFKAMKAKYKERIKQMEKAHKNQIGKFKASKDKDMKHLQDKNAKQLQQQQEKYEKSAAKLKARYEKKISDQIEKHSKELEQRIFKNQSEMTSFKDQKEEEFKGTLANLKQEHKSDLDNLNDAHKQQLDDVKSGYESKIEDLSTKHKAEIEYIEKKSVEKSQEVSQDYNFKIKHLKNSHNEILDDERNKFKRKLDEQRVEYEGTIESNKEEFEKTKLELSQKLKQQQIEQMQKISEQEIEHSSTIKKQQDEHDLEMKNQQQKYENMLKVQSKEATSKLEGNTEKFKKELSELKLNAEKTLEEEQSKHSKELEEMKKLHSEQVEKINSEHKSEIKEKDGSHKTELEETNNRWKTKLKEFEEHAENRLKDEKKRHHDDLAELNAKFDKQMDEQRNLHHKDVESHLGDHHKDLQKREEDNFLLISTLKKDRIVALHEQKVKYENIIDEMKEDHRIKIEDMKTLHLKEVTEIREENSKNLKEAMSRKEDEFKSFIHDKELAFQKEKELLEKKWKKKLKKLAQQHNKTMSEATLSTLTEANKLKSTIKLHETTRKGLESWIKGSKQTSVKQQEITEKAAKMAKDAIHEKLRLLNHLKTTTEETMQAKMKTISLIREATDILRKQMAQEKLAALQKLKEEFTAKLRETVVAFGKEKEKEISNTKANYKEIMEDKLKKLKDFYIKDKGQNVGRLSKKHQEMMDAMKKEMEDNFQSTMDKTVKQHEESLKELEEKLNKEKDIAIAGVTEELTAKYTTIIKEKDEEFKNSKDNYESQLSDANKSIAQMRQKIVDLTDDHQKFREEHDKKMEEMKQEYERQKRADLNKAVSEAVEKAKSIAEEKYSSIAEKQNTQLASMQAKEIEEARNNAIKTTKQEYLRALQSQAKDFSVQYILNLVQEKAFAIGYTKMTEEKKRLEEVSQYEKKLSNLNTKLSDSESKYNKLVDSSGEWNKEKQALEEKHQKDLVNEQKLGYDKGYKEGYDKGYAAGKVKGYARGCAESQAKKDVELQELDQKYREEMEESIKEEKQKSYKEGYGKGYAAGKQKELEIRKAKIAEAMKAEAFKAEQVKIERRNKRKAQYAKKVKGARQILEVNCFSMYFDAFLQNNENIDHLLPLVESKTNPKQTASTTILSKCKDGLLLAGMINVAVPDTIDERVLNKHDKMADIDFIAIENLDASPEIVHQNINLVLGAAKSIGVIRQGVNGDTLFQADENQPKMAVLLRELAKVHLYYNITLERHPELVRLLDDDSTAVEEKPSGFLLKWVNYHTKGHFGKLEDVTLDKVKMLLGTLVSIKKEAGDVKDDSIKIDQFRYGKLCNVDKLGDDLDEIFKLCKELNVSPFFLWFKQKHNLSGSTYMKFFLAMVFHIYNGLKELSKEEEKEFEKAGLLEFDADQNREELVLRMWINSTGIPDRFRINNLFSDCQDGIVLSHVFDKVEKGIVNWKRVELRCNNVFKRVSNCNYVVTLGNKLNFITVNIGGEDVQRGSRNLTCSLVYQLMRYHLFKYLKQVQSKFGSKKRKVDQKDIAQWSNKSIVTSEHVDKLLTTKFSNYQNLLKKSYLNLRKFQDRNLSNSLYFFFLLSSIEPRVVNWDLVHFGQIKDGSLVLTEEQKLLNARYIISCCRMLGAFVFLLPEHIIEVKQKMIVALVASILGLTKK